MAQAHKATDSVDTDVLTATITSPALVHVHAFV